MAEIKQDILNIVEGTQKQANDAALDVLSIYKRNLDSVRQQIADIYLRYTVDGELKISQQQRLTELAALDKQLSEQINELYPKEVKTITNAVTNAAENAYYSTLYTIDKGIQDGVKVAPLNPKFAERLAETRIEGKTFSDRIWQDTSKLAAQVHKDVEQALIQGTSPEKLARKVKSDFGSTAYQAQRVINTEVARATTAAQMESYKASGVVNRVMWDATLEDNTCDECAALDGKVFDIDDAPSLPIHPNCRCALIPVVDGWQPTEKRENVKDPDTGEKRVIDYTNVQSWKESRGIDAET
ncbi:minor capsid protein [Enterococcus sp.]|uniref:minor capsid protein n=1 Tax=Enterococcus sp. TaxID=35783 RepID=UPI00289CD05D|nr:minor capsid protein [Enterococcus sp.]